MVGIEDAPATRVRNNEDFDRQESSALARQEHILQKGLQKSDAGVVKALMLHAMNNTDACWKGDPKIMAASLNKLKTEGKQRDALQTNISICVVGFGCWLEAVSYHMES